MNESQGHRENEVASYALIVLYVAGTKMEQEGHGWIEALNGAEIQVDPPFADAVAALIHETASRIALPSLSVVVGLGDAFEQGAFAKSVGQAIARAAHLDLDEELLRWECEELARRLFSDKRPTAVASADPHVPNYYRAEVVGIEGATVLELAWQPGQSRKEALTRLWRELRGRELNRFGAS